MNQTEPVHISQIRQGDTILHHGEVKTVTGTDIRTGGFMGTTVFGDSYRMGHLPVSRVVFLGHVPKVFLGHLTDTKA